MFAMRARALFSVRFFANPTLLAQRPTSSPAAPAFDVATIKPHQGMLMMTGVTNTADGVNGSATTLSMLVHCAYGLRAEGQVSGAPDWAKTDRFDAQTRMGEADIAAVEKLKPCGSEGKAHTDDAGTLGGALQNEGPFGG
jgi:hypothetical protein